jgi:N-acetylglutamate synthase-like GNAT family acetyltransferase
MEMIEQLKLQYIQLLDGSVELSEQHFLTQLKKISTYGSIIVAYQKKDDEQIELIACATLIIEPKIVLKDKCIGHVEDVVVIDTFKQKGLMKFLLDRIKKIAKLWDCEKILITCDLNKKTLYEKNGFTQSSIVLTHSLDELTQKKRSIYDINVLPLEKLCKHCCNIIQRNKYLSMDNISITSDATLFIYFINIEQTDSFDESVEKLIVLDKLNNVFSGTATILMIVHVVDLMQKYKIVSNDGVDYLYISTISQFNGFEFEWKKDNDFLDKILNEKIMTKYI